jgi:hypothetical protein
MNAHPAARVCGHFAELCGDDSRKQCDEAFDGFAKVMSPDDVAPSVKCVGNAQNCAEAAGCLAGAAGKAGIKAAGQFWKGLTESIGK